MCRVDFVDLTKLPQAMYDQSSTDRKIDILTYKYQNMTLNTYAV